MLLLASSLMPAALALSLPSSGEPLEVALEPDRDTTIYESTGGFIANGSGQYAFVGANGGSQLRRALLHFDVGAAVPASAEVLSADLRIHVSKVASPVVRPARLHRAEAAWGESGSDAFGEEGSGAPALPGDATWLHTFSATDFWTNVGGDFAPAASATIGIGPVGFYTLTDPGLTADVQAWLDDPASNLGWFLVGTETGSSTAKRLDSSESVSPGTAPRLTVRYRESGCDPDVIHSEVVRLGSPPNPPAFLLGTTSGPVLGSTWDPVIDHTTFVPDAVADLVVLTGGPANVPAGVPGTVLCDLAATPVLVFTTPGPGVPFQIPIPDSCSFSGFTLCVQGVALDASFQPHLPNAIDITLGSE